MALRQHGLLQLGSRPGLAGVGAHVHAGDAAAAAPGEPADFPPASLRQRRRVCRRRDDRLRVHHEAEHARGPVGERVRVLRGLLARHERPIGELDAADPLHVGAALPARHEEPRRIALLGAKRLAVLAVGDQRVVPGFLDGDAAGHHGGVFSLGEEPLGARLHAHLAEQGGEGNARPFTRARQAVDDLGGEVGSRAAVGRGAVPGALEEAEPRDRRKSPQRREVEDRGALDHAVDQELVAVRVDGGDAGVMALIVQVRRGDDAAQVLERRQ